MFMRLVTPARIIERFAQLEHYLSTLEVSAASRRASPGTAGNKLFDNQIFEIRAGHGYGRCQPVGPPRQEELRASPASVRLSETALRSSEISVRSSEMAVKASEKNSLSPITPIFSTHTSNTRFFEADKFFPPVELRLRITALEGVQAALEYHDETGRLPSIDCFPVFEFEIEPRAVRSEEHTSEL